MNVSKLTGTAIVPLLGLALAPANAADMPVKAPLLKAPPKLMPSWTGCYIGASIGAASQGSDYNEPFEAPSPVGPFAGDNNGTSFIGGGQIGCNYQTGMFVFGLEGDYSGLTKPSSLYFSQGAPVDPGNSYGSDISWMATIRGRVGVTFGDGTNLLYATGGVAFTDVHASGFEGVGRPFHDYSSSRTGWVAGGGYEKMLTANWIIGIEGLFADFGSYTSGPAGKSAIVHNTVGIGRARLSYKF